MNLSHQQELDSLLTLKFQLFTEEQIKKAEDFDKAAPTCSLFKSLPAAPDIKTAKNTAHKFAKAV